MQICDALIQDLLKTWQQNMKTGAIYGRPLSIRTRHLHSHNIKPILECLDVLTEQGLINAFIKSQSQTQTKEDAKRKHQYDAVVSFAKSVVFNNHLEGKVLEELKKYRPRRFYPPKRTVVRQEDINLLLLLNDRVSGNTHYEKLLNRTLVLLIFNTGLRSQECADLKMKDVDLESRVLSIKFGKGNKNRRVGINDEAFTLLKQYFDNRPKTKSQNVFVFKNGKPISREALAQRFSRLAKRAGLDASLHSLRRGFATKNAEAGRPLTLIQAALGHSSLVTTQNYILPDIEAGIREMKKW